MAGSIHWRTGRVILREGKPKEGRGGALFCRHLDDLRRAFRHYKVIHVLYDNAGFHTADGSKLVRAYLKEWGHRVKVHYLPKYSPDTNPIERVWRRRHEAVTRNYRCHTMREFLDLTFDWFETRNAAFHPMIGIVHFFDASWIAKYTNFNALWPSTTAGKETEMRANSDFTRSWGEPDIFRHDASPSQQNPGLRRGGEGYPLGA